MSFQFPNTHTHINIYIYCQILKYVCFSTFEMHSINFIFSFIHISQRFKRKQTKIEHCILMLYIFAFLLLFKFFVAIVFAVSINLLDLDTEKSAFIYYCRFYCDCLNVFYQFEIFSCPLSIFICLPLSVFVVQFFRPNIIFILSMSNKCISEH